MIGTGFGSADVKREFPPPRSIREVQSMTLDELRASVGAHVPPASVRGPLLALWYDAKGDWDAAHRVAQDIDDPSGAWVHAYLHRKEGDAGNAAYWYRRAGRHLPAITLEDEWMQIASALLPGDA